MKALILAAGRSIRMQPIPDKNFLNFLGKPLIIRQVEALLKASFRDICIVGGKHNLALLRRAIREANVKNARIAIREQKNLNLGMAGAVLAAATWIKNDPFLVVSSNDVLDQSAYELFHKHHKKDEGLLLAYKVSKYFPGGYLEIGSKNIIRKIVEKPGAGKEPSKLVNIVMHYHPDPRALFEALKKTSSARPSKISKDDLYERALQSLFPKITYRVLPFSGFWQPIKYPWHVLAITKHYISRIEEIFPRGRIGGKPAEVAKTATVRGTDVYFEDGVRVLDNAVIIGPAYIGKNTVIATNALVRESHIGANCVIGFGSEVARSYIGDNVWTHTNYIGDSIIGNDVSFGAGAVTGNLRLDEKNIAVMINGEKVDSGTHKFGLVTGDHVRVGINTSFMPGVKIGSHSFIGAGITIEKEVPKKSFVTGEHILKIKKNREKFAPRSL